MLEGLLPIGSVVLLKNSTKRVMIIGVCQVGANDPTRVWDYVGAPFPEGFLGPDKTYLFDGEQIERIYSVGYQDEEQFAFKVKADAAMENIRNNTEAENKGE
ncbi:MAG: DUF4176 domain-containing protein [Lachnospiraceae bacterium]|nr:DUF4176 domain-containing protein [Lachnospiraceae bacterium]